MLSRTKISHLLWKFSIKLRTKFALNDKKNLYIHSTWLMLRWYLDYRKKVRCMQVYLVFYHYYFLLSLCTLYYLIIFNTLICIFNSISDISAIHILNAVVNLGIWTSSGFSVQPRPLFIQIMFLPWFSLSSKVFWLISSDGQLYESTPD